MLAGVLFVAVEAHARPGGGESFRGGGAGGGGGGGGYHGGGGGGGGGGTGVMLWLVFSALPWPVKVLVVVGVVGIYVVRQGLNGRMRDWSSAGAQPVMLRVPATGARSARRRLEDLTRFDPDFSVALFEDFLYALYAHVRYGVAGGRIDKLSAYLAPETLAALRNVHVAEVHAVIVGALRFTDVRGLELAAGQVEVDLEIEANVATIVAPGQPERTSYLLERWTLSRRRDARSRPPARARVLACPGCGAPLDAVVSGTCTHCKRVVSNGDFDWIVRAAHVVRSEATGPMLTTEVAERGNELPTVVDPEAEVRLAALARKDPLFQWPSFEQRVGLAFREFQQAWTERDLARMRAYFTDALFDTQRYWVEAYRAQGLRNRTDGARVVRLELSRVASDRWFDTITVRLSATGADYVVRDADGKVVRGNPKRDRPYTEYWTFLRAAGRSAPARTQPECPSCGAPLAIGMAGDCRYCRAKVTTGEFDWVLSRIEQDEVYGG